VLRPSLAGNPHLAWIHSDPDVAKSINYKSIDFNSYPA